MKTRLAMFAFALLLLPAAGAWLSDTPPQSVSAGTTNIPAVLLTTLAMAIYTLLVQHLARQITGHGPFDRQPRYFLWAAAAGTVLCWLLAYLNLYSAAWVMSPGNPVMQGLLYTPLYALLLPAVLATRALLGAFPALLRSLSAGPALPVPGQESLVMLLLPLALLGLAGGAAWPGTLAWLLWLAPLLLLVSLQLLWGEGTVFAGLKNGDWGRVTCAALAGVVVGNVAIAAYRYNGGDVILMLPIPFFAQTGYAVFGLLCLQLGDVIAEHWRGRSRDEPPPKKRFPIPVVTRKN